jgi:hypothetical protein
VDQLNVRAEVDERDAARVQPGANVIASVRGDTSHQFKLRFVRFEPFVVPKRNLNGDGGERVDTRVLQVIYGIDPRVTVRPGQQLDILIEAN